MNSEDKLKHIQEHKLKNFKCPSSGQTLDLTKLNEDASPKQRTFKTEIKHFTM